MPLYLNHITVYGSLRRGQSRDFLEKTGCKYLGTYQISGRLWDLGDFPGYSKEHRGEEKVVVDLFKLPKNKTEKIKVLKTLDRVENFLYNRETIMCFGYGVEAYIYTVRDWVMEGKEQITPSNPADWVEWVKSKSIHA